MTDLEWQAAEGSRTLHVVDTSKLAWRNADGSRRRSGPKSACGRYPQRNAESPWFALAVGELDLTSPTPYLLTICDECREALATLNAGVTR